MSQEQRNLTPVQEKAARQLQAYMAASNVCVLSGRTGIGKTSILHHLLAAEGGVLLDARDLMKIVKIKDPGAIEEAFQEMIEAALAANNLVLVDDFQLVTDIAEDCRYARPNVLWAAVAALIEGLTPRERLVFATSECVPDILLPRSRMVKIGNFKVEDYRVIFRSHLPADLAVAVDVEQVHHVVPKLNGRQLADTCAWLIEHAQTSTDELVTYLKTEYLSSNVELTEVQPVDWKDLKGVDEVIRALEAKIALPFENPELAHALNLKPKRGVLLAGPPGTGKTTIGRALAHRLKSKFFMIDGTMVAGSNDFYHRVGRVFSAAKRNAPSIVFIDDADVIFDGEGDRGFYRYLLTVLDGLESASSERVCVMMTAMHVGSLPAAIVRSGRVELWLETKLPDVEARAAILAERIAELPEPLRSANPRPLAEAARGLTGADLKTVVEDAKLLYAYDLTTSSFTRAPEQYFAEAIRTIRGARRKYGKSRPPRLTEEATIGFDVVRE